MLGDGREHYASSWGRDHSHLKHPPPFDTTFSPSFHRPRTQPPHPLTPEKCTKHSTRAEALAKLDAGASFADMAREYSEDKARQGGSLGWKNRGELLKEFETVAFELAVSSSLVGGKGLVVGECRTGEGYHLVCVEGRR